MSRSGNPFFSSSPARTSRSGPGVVGAPDSWFRRVSAPTGSGQVANTVEHQAALAYRLTERDRWLLRMVFEHRVLHAGQISAVAFPSANSARQRLRELHHWSVLDRFRPRAAEGTAAQHYVLGPAGATVLAAEQGLEPKRVGYRGDRAMSIAHSPRLAHTVGRNGWFLALINRAASGGCGEVLSAWWSEHRCARHFGDLVRPDGYGRWHGPDPAAGELEFFLEYDRGTETTATVARKLDGYAQLATATGIATPVLVWLPSTAREPGVRAMLARAWRSLEHPEAVPVATAAATLLDPEQPTASPAEPVWLPLGPTRSNRDEQRLALSELRTAWPQLSDLAATSNEDTPAPADQAAVSAPYPMPPPSSPTLRRGGGSARG